MRNRIDEQTAAARVRFVEAMEREFPGANGGAELCRMLMRLSTTHRRLQVYRLKVQDCNGRLGYGWKVRDQRCKRRIVELCATFGHDGHEVVPVFNGDPDGTTVKLRVPSGSTDDFSQVGVRVPAGRI